MLATSERWWDTWRARSEPGRPRPDTATAREWFDEEHLAWDQLREVAVNFRHARTRFRLIDGLRTGAARDGFARPAVPFPLYADEPLPEGACEPACKAEIERADHRLRTLAEPIEQVLDDLGDRQATVRSLEADGKRSRPPTSAGAASIRRRSGNRSRSGSKRATTPPAEGRGGAADARRQGRGG